MKDTKIITIGFDTVESIIVLNNFSEYNIKLVEFDNKNYNNGCSFLVFEGMYGDMEEFYNNFYNTGESFKEYLYNY